MATETSILLIVIIVVAGAFRVGFYNDTWGYAPIGMLMTILVVLLLWTVLTGRTPGTATADLKAGVQEAGQELKEVGRTTADSIRKTIQ